MKEETMTVKEFLGKDGKTEMTLADLPIGESGVIKTVGGEGALRRRFLDMGLTPKTHIMVRKVAPMGDPIEICLRGYELTLRREDAERIEIEECTEAKEW